MDTALLQFLNSIKKKTSYCSSEDDENETSLGEMLYEKNMQKDKFRGSLRDSMKQERKMRKDDRDVDEKGQIVCFWLI